MVWCLEEPKDLRRSSTGWRNWMREGVENNKSISQLQSTLHKREQPVNYALYVAVMHPILAFVVALGFAVSAVILYMLILVA